MRPRGGHQARRKQQTAVRRGKVILQINELPDEILSRIFSMTILSGTRSAILPCQLVCRKWQNVCEPALTRNVCLTSAARFLQWVNGVQLRDDRFALLRSLSVYLVTPLPEKCYCNLTCIDPLPRTSQQGINHVARHPSSLGTTEGLRRLLELLPGLLRQMTYLTTFSLRIENAPSNLWCGCYEPTVSMALFAKVLQSLPRSCVNLEFDTGGIEDRFTKAKMRDQLFRRGDRQAQDLETPTNPQGTAGPVLTRTPTHLCDDIRRIIPRLNHLRLRLSHICPFIFLAGAGSQLKSGSTAPESPGSSMVAPNLETCSINLVTSPRNSQELCFSYSMLHHSQLNFKSWLQHRDLGLKHFAQVIRDSLHRNVLRLAKIEKFEIFHAEDPGEDDVHQAGYSSSNSPTEEYCSFGKPSLISCYDIHNNCTYRMPFKQFGSVPDSTTYHFRTFDECIAKDQNDQTLIGSLAQIEQSMEGTWATSALGTRHPIKAFDAEDDLLIRDFGSTCPTVVDGPGADRSTRDYPLRHVKLGRAMDMCQTPAELRRLMSGIGAVTTRHEGFVHYSTSE